MHAWFKQLIIHASRLNSATFFLISSASSAVDDLLNVCVIDSVVFWADAGESESDVVDETGDCNGENDAEGTDANPNGDGDDDDDDADDNDNEDDEEENWERGSEDMEREGEGKEEEGEGEGVKGEEEEESEDPSKSSLTATVLPLYSAL